MNAKAILFKQALRVMATTVLLALFVSTNAHAQKVPCPRYTCEALATTSNAELSSFTTSSFGETSESAQQNALQACEDNASKKQPLSFNCQVTNCYPYHPDSIMGQFCQDSWLQQP